MGTFEVYQVKRGRSKGQWHWRLRANNGEIVATGHESYHNKADVLDAVVLVKASVSALVEVEGE